MKLLPFLLIFATLFNIQFAFEPFYAGKMDAIIEINWSIHLKGDISKISEAHFTVFYFSDEAELISASHPYKLKSDENNTFIVFTIPPAENIEVSYRTRVRTNYQKPKQDHSSPFLEYFKESPLVKINEKMRKKALEIGGNRDTLETLVRITEWVHNWVEYDLGQGDIKRDSQWTFENRKGTCDEFAHLLIGMVRSLNIPARFVSGYAHSGEKWSPHGWAEIYLPEYGWIPVDPTYNEFFLLDATHIKLGVGVDQSYIKEKFEVSGRSVKDIDIAISSPTLNISANIENFNKMVEIELIVPEVNESGEYIVRAKVKNPSSDTLFLPLRLSAPKEIKIMKENRLLYLKPFETKNIEWNVFINLPKIEKNIIYKLPLKVITFGTEVEKSIKVLSEEPQEPFIYFQEEKVKTFWLYIIIGVAILSIGFIIIIMIKRL